MGRGAEAGKEAGAMSDLHVRSDSVDVEQIMKQIRARIREKRGADYTDAELQQLASVKLEQFADPSNLRSDLLEQFRQRSNEPSTYHRHRGPRRWLLMMLHPLLKRIQKQLMSDLNLYFEIIHNLVVEVTRLGIETQNLKMRVEALSSRLDFDERRSRALEGVVRPAATSSTGTTGSTGTAGATGNSVSNSRGWIPTPPPPRNVPPAVVATIAAPVSTSTGIPGSTTPPGAPSVPGQSQGQGQGQARPEGRRRRRRRRRRPGQTLAESPNAGGHQATDINAPATSNHEPPNADGSDEDDGGSDQ
jgi:hypothetical protein